MGETKRQKRQRANNMIQFTVLGKPQPAGSKRAFPYHKKVGGDLGVRVADANPEAKTWKMMVAAAAREAYDGPLLTGPLQVTMLFTQRRPKCHYGTGRNANILKPSAPLLPIVKPDVLKLARPVEDAMNGFPWRDDSQTTDLILRKRYGEHPGAGIVIENKVSDEALLEGWIVVNQNGSAVRHMDGGITVYPTRSIADTHATKFMWQKPMRITMTEKYDNGKDI